jgi:hypothetical protein
MYLKGMSVNTNRGSSILPAKHPLNSVLSQNRTKSPSRSPELEVEPVGYHRLRLRLRNLHLPPPLIAHPSSVNLPTGQAPTLVYHFARM